MNSLPLQQHVNLKKFNTFGISVKSRFFIAINQLDMLTALLQTSEFKTLPKLILGGGSNILFTQDYPGLVIKNEIMGRHVLSENDEEVILQFGAGENWHDIVLYCIERNYGGIENLSLIPGTVGAAPIQNIGAYGAELKDVFLQLEAIELATGKLRVFSHSECKFGYRDSIFKTTLKDQFLITRVTLKLHKKKLFNTQYAALQEKLKNQSELSLKVISDAVIDIRTSKLPDPKQIGNAGSFFKNPIISAEQFQQLKKCVEKDVPHFTEEREAIKIPAAWLIEQCGWKGKRVGEVGVHDKQALVIVNYGEGNGAEIWKLAQQIQASVWERFGIKLTPEVNIV